MAFSTLPKTFSEVQDYIITKIGQKYPTIGAFLYNSFLHIFIDVIAYAIALFMDFADNLYSESHLPSAVNYENIRRIAEFYGYTAHREISANGICVRISMDSTYSTLPTESVTFTKYDPIQINGIYYLINETITLSKDFDDDSYADHPGEYYIDVDVIQGQLITVTNTAQGLQSEEFSIDDEHFENTDPTVEVNSVAYTKVDSFFISESTDLVYTLRNKSYLNGVIAAFGDGFRGARLVAGDVVTITYIKTDALDGQIKSIGFPVTFLTTYTYTDASPVDPVGITIAQIIGADLKETADSIKYWGQKSISQMDLKAFNNEEIALALHEMGGVLQSKAISEYDIDPETPTAEFMNRVKLMVVPTTGTVIDNTFKQEIRSYLHTRMDFTDFIEFIDVDYVNVLFILDVDARSTAPKNIATDISTFLQSTYSLANAQFGESIDNSTAIAALQAEFSTDIIRFYLDLKIQETDDAPSMQTGDIVSYTLQMGDLRVGFSNVADISIAATFKVGATTYTETLVDNGSGVITSSGTNFITSGSVNYVTGVITLNLKATVTDVTQMIYTYSSYDIDGEIGNIDIKYFQVAQYGSSTINVEFI